MDIGRAERRRRGRVCSQPHRQRNAYGIDDDCGQIGCQQAHAKQARRRRGRSGPTRERVHQHAERRDHEIDARARLFDQEQVLAREIAFARLKRERRPGRDADQPCRRTQDPQQIVRRSVGVVALQAPGDQRRRPEQDEPRLHAATPERRRRERSSAHTTERCDEDRRHPHDLRFGAARDADGEIGHTGRQRQRLVDVGRIVDGVPHDLLHGDERGVARQQAVGEPQRGDRPRPALRSECRDRSRRGRRCGFAPTAAAAPDGSNRRSRPAQGSTPGIRPRPVRPEISIEPVGLPRHLPITTIGRLAKRSGMAAGSTIVDVESREGHVDPGEHRCVDVAPEPRRGLRSFAGLCHDERFAESRLRDALDEKPVHAAADAEGRRS